MNDLTTLATAKSWMAVSSDTDDVQIERLIRAVSAFILSYIGLKAVVKTRFVDQFTGTGGAMKILRNYPVIDIAGVSVDGQSVPASGFCLEVDGGTPYGCNQGLSLSNVSFGRVPCAITYNAGYFVTAEPQVAADSVMVDGFDGAWMLDGGVAYAGGGAALVAVAGDPAQGQYALGDRGEYLFAPADFGVPVLISYSYVPAALEQACLELVAERYAYKERVGQSSVNVSGTVTAFKLTDMPDYVRASLAPFRRMVPV